jgi:hypothetical protein
MPSTLELSALCFSKNIDRVVADVTYRTCAVEAARARGKEGF